MRDCQKAPKSKLLTFFLKLPSLPHPPPSAGRPNPGGEELQAVHRHRVLHWLQQPRQQLAVLRLRTRGPVPELRLEGGGLPTIHDLNHELSCGLYRGLHRSLGAASNSNSLRARSPLLVFSPIDDLLLLLISTHITVSVLITRDMYEIPQNNQQPLLSPENSVHDSPRPPPSAWRRSVPRPRETRPQQTDRLSFPSRYHR